MDVSVPRLVDARSSVHAELDGQIYSPKILSCSENAHFNWTHACFALSAIVMHTYLFVVCIFFIRHLKQKINCLGSQEGFE